MRRRALVRARGTADRCGKSPAPPNAVSLVALASLAARSSSVSSVFRASRVVFASATGPRPARSGADAHAGLDGFAPGTFERRTRGYARRGRTLAARLRGRPRAQSTERARRATDETPPKLPTAPVAAAARLAPVGGTVPGAPGMSPAT